MHHREPHNLSNAECERRRRQHDEICASISAGQMHRAADLAHEHLAEFPDDHTVRSTLLAALEHAADQRLQRRRSEFTRI
jgi:hypothetical protein